MIQPWARTQPLHAHFTGGPADGIVGDWHELTPFDQYVELLCCSDLGRMELYDRRNPHTEGLGPWHRYERSDRYPIPKKCLEFSYVGVVE